MKPRMLFDHNGNALRTRRRGRAARIVVPLLAIVSLVLLYGAMQAQDDDAELQAMRLVELDALQVSAFEAGRQAGREELMQAMHVAGLEPMPRTSLGCSIAPPVRAARAGR